MADTNGIGRHHFQVKTYVRETGIKEILDNMYNDEFEEVSSNESKKKREMSQQDMRFMEILDEGIKLKDGHYHIPFPFKLQDVRLPCNKYQATQRLSYFKRKFDKNEKFKADYIRLWKRSLLKVTQGSQQREKHQGRRGTFHTAGYITLINQEDKGGI